MIDLKNAKDLHSKFSKLPRWCIGLSDDVDDNGAAIYAELIVPELIHKPCARLSWCPYGTESLKAASNDEFEPQNYETCLVHGIICPAYVFGNPFCDPSAEDPGYTDGSNNQEDDGDFVTICAHCYEVLVEAAEPGNSAGIERR